MFSGTKSDSQNSAPRGGVFEHIWARVVNEQQFEGLGDVHVRAACSIASQTINDTENHDGFTPKLEIQEMARRLTIRESALVSCIHLDNATTDKLMLNEVIDASLPRLTTSAAKEGS